MFGARTNKKKNSSDQKKNRWASQNVCNDSLSNNQCDKGVMKVPPEISCMSAVRAHYGGVISCNISGRPWIYQILCLFYILIDLGGQNPLLHLNVSSYIWACICRYFQHHASLLVNHYIWLKELNSQTEADSVIWQNFWKMLI